jgi:hypothetical protein
MNQPWQNLANLEIRQLAIFINQTYEAPIVLGITILALPEHLQDRVSTRQHSSSGTQETPTQRPP